jgi:hypothetical protein
MTVDDDFGFSFVNDATELPEVKKIIAHSHDMAQGRAGALEEVLSLMNKFLDKLQQNPEKKLLHWPDRAAKVKAFQDRLNNLAN